MRTHIRQMSFQRNGISGVAFYTILFDFELKDEHETCLIATFETKENYKTGNEMVIVERTRVISPLNIKFGWRGDDFGSAIQAELKRLKQKHKTNSIFEVMERGDFDE